MMVWDGMKRRRRVLGGAERHLFILVDAAHGINYKFGEVVWDKAHSSHEIRLHHSPLPMERIETWNNTAYRYLCTA